ncbi:hypothetical protein ACA910_010931 [Epithemia clementina (nom. ined.)]
MAKEEEEEENDIDNDDSDNSAHAEEEEDPKDHPRRRRCDIDKKDGPTHICRTRNTAAQTTKKGKQEKEQEDGSSVASDHCQKNSRNKIMLNGDSMSEDDLDEIDKDTNNEKKDGENDEEGDEDDYDECIEDDSSSSSSLVDRGAGLASQHGPLVILEIGCGDVPLGVELAHELQQAVEPSAAPHNIVQQIICADYSATVIAQMQHEHATLMQSLRMPPKQQQQQHVPNRRPMTTRTTKTKADDEDMEEEEDHKHPTSSCSCTLTTNRGDANDHDNDHHDPNQSSSILQFVVADARHLPYESESVTLLLEKGTLDAMLSDPVHGTDHCRQTVRECARVLAVGGYMVLISHQNAHTANGLQWLYEIVFEGLKQQEQQGQLPGGQSLPGQEQSESEQKLVAVPASTASTAAAAAAALESDNGTANKSHDESSKNAATANQSSKDRTSHAVDGGDNGGGKSKRRLFRWTIEVHGKDDASRMLEDDDDDETETKKEETPAAPPRGGPGPAVYIIHKEPIVLAAAAAAAATTATDGSKDAPEAKADADANRTTRPTQDDNDDESTIPIRFYSY